MSLMGGPTQGGGIKTRLRPPPTHLCPIPCFHILPTPGLVPWLSSDFGHLVLIKTEGVMTLRAHLSRAPSGDFSSLIDKE